MIAQEKTWFKTPTWNGETVNEVYIFQKIGSYSEEILIIVTAFLEKLGFKHEKQKPRGNCITVNLNQCTIDWSYKSRTDKNVAVPSQLQKWSKEHRGIVHGINFGI